MWFIRYLIVYLCFFSRPFLSWCGTDASILVCSELNQFITIGSLYTSIDKVTAHLIAHSMRKLWSRTMQYWMQCRGCFKWRRVYSCSASFVSYIRWYQSFMLWVRVLLVPLLLHTCLLALRRNLQNCSVWSVEQITCVCRSPSCRCPAPLSA